MLILITGASGSGTSTLGQALAAHLAYTHLESDDYFWLPTPSPYTEKRDENQRLNSLLSDLQTKNNAVVSGSIMDWGILLENMFDLIVFLYLDATIRLQRLQKREVERFGMADPAFMEWAAQYDAGTNEGRSLAKHQAWLSARTCQILKLFGDISNADRLKAVLERLPTNIR